MQRIPTKGMINDDMTGTIAEWGLVSKWKGKWEGRKWSMRHPADAGVGGPKEHVGSLVILPFCNEMEPESETGRRRW